MILYVLVIIALLCSLILPMIIINKEKYENYAVERPLEYFKTILDKNTVAEIPAATFTSDLDPMLIAKHVAALFDNEYDIISAKHVGIRTTNVILHRLDKMYGISIDVQTTYPPLKIIHNNVAMVSQDTFSFLGESHESKSQFDKKITRDAEFEKEFLADHYEKIKRYRGITIE